MLADQTERRGGSSRRRLKERRLWFDRRIEDRSFDGPNQRYDPRRMCPVRRLGVRRDA